MSCVTEQRLMWSFVATVKPTVDAATQRDGEGSPERPLHLIVEWSITNDRLHSLAVGVSSYCWST